ncbi:MAG TPA: hypothetical protein VLX92_17765 [Kofleriaceae bacterium]|nr:hypothetical protein [Kofleriaceae bacterium]
MSRSRTSTCRSDALAALAIAAAIVACHGKPKALAELTKADGPVDRQPAGTTDWRGAPLGTEFFLGEAARTGDGAAQLRLLGTAQIAMQPHTVLRFGGGADAAKISVEVGEISLSGAGSYGLDLGNVTLDSAGAVRITAKGNGQSALRLLVGQAQVASADGKVTTLSPGQEIELGLGNVVVADVRDAGVDAAPPPADAAVDAAVDTEATVQIAVTGRRAEVQLPGEPRWTPLPAGAGTIAKGAKLRLGAGTSAKLTAHDTTLDLAAGSRAVVGDDLMMGLELGSARASVPADTQGKVGVPGGEVALAGSKDGPAEAKLDVNARGEAKVTILRGDGKLDVGGAPVLDMPRGESATLARTGTVHVLEAIPNYFDLSVPAGESFTIHDPKGTTALQLAFDGKCPGGGVIEMDRDARFRAAKISGGKDGANLQVGPGAWAYRLRCTVGGEEGAAVASGRVVELRDDGRRPLPPRPGKNSIDADGHNYHISYQSQIPIIEVHYAGAGSAFTLHLATGGADETFDSATPVFAIPGTKLREATYTFWVDHDGTRQDKTSTLKIDFDQTAPQVYIESPPNAVAFPPEIDVRGAVLPGWTAKVEGNELPIDPATRRFAAKVSPPGTAQALAIRLSHPSHGVHYYLRRPK